MLSSRDAHGLVIHTSLLVLVLVVNDGVLVAREELAEWATTLDRRRVPGVIDEALDLQVEALQDFELALLDDVCWRCGRLGLDLRGLAVLEVSRKARHRLGLGRAQAARRSDSRERLFCLCADRSDGLSVALACANYQLFRKFKFFCLSFSVAPHQNFTSES